MSCPDCFKGSILAEKPAGNFTSLDGAYLSPAPPDIDEESKSRAVVLFTDIFGLPLNNPKVIADSLAKRLKCDVWVPDQFGGQPPFPVEKMKHGPPERPGEKFSFFWFALSILPYAWKLFKNRPAVTDGRVKAFMDKLKTEKPQYKKIGAVGYCYGGATCVRFAATDYIHSTVICHPGLFSDQELKAIKVPCSWVCAEEDFTFKPALRMKAEAEFVSRKPPHEYEFKDYKGTTHGFASRPNFEYPEIKEAFEGAMDQIVGWFEKTLVVETSKVDVEQPGTGSS
ncbi:dienelactone hydrolase endo-1,3,1,4-beta-D-glucanase [Marasmius fiardii PR-910]|nr:dienelactone hydrolase endo-1,3,1,4-beta-D-glucanase [Marasmius fiardii PR-910]